MNIDHKKPENRLLSEDSAKSKCSGEFCDKKIPHILRPATRLWERQSRNTRPWREVSLPFKL